MTDEILLIPEKNDTERDLVAKTWIHNNGIVIKVSKFWEPPLLDNSKRITIYGNDTFCLVLVKIIGVQLITIKDEVLSELSYKWVKREIKILKLKNIDNSLFPTFIKPVKPKTFTSKVYDNHTNFIKETKGIELNEKIIQSNIIQINDEARAFILNNEILDLALYKGDINLSSAKNFLIDFLSNCLVNLPKSFVVDLGYNNIDQWFIIEFNSSWGAGLNRCNANKVIYGIREATTV